MESSSLDAIDEVVLPFPEKCQPFSTDEMNIWTTLYRRYQSQGKSIKWGKFHLSWILEAKKAKVIDKACKVFNRSANALENKGKDVRKASKKKDSN